MSRRFINCSACGGCHTGRGGRYCQFISPTKSTVQTAGTVKMAEASILERDSPEYEHYLKNLIEEEEARLSSLKEKCRITSMEEQLARLKLQSAELEVQHGDGTSDCEEKEETGVAGRLLTATRRGRAARPSSSAPVSNPSDANLFRQRSKEERDTLSKLVALTHLPEAKTVEKVTYRDFICAMTKVLKIVIESGLDPSLYAAHMSFISTKAALNLYATDAIIKY